MTTDQGRVERTQASEDAVRKIQRLKKSLARSKKVLAEQAPGSPALLERPSELCAELEHWEEQLEQIRCDVAELLAERDRLRISHDKLRERLDRHTLEPRSDAQRPAQSSRQPVARPRATDESQDFTAIDKELERLNASMMRAFSQE